MTTQSMAHENNIQPAVSSMEAVKPKRYHPMLVAIHWIMALLILMAVLLVGENEGGERFEGGRRGEFSEQGFFQGNNSPVQAFDADEAPQGISPAGFAPQEGSQGILSSIGIHMIIGFALLFLLILRLIVRWTTKHPEWATAGSKFFDWIGGLTHFGLYLLTFGMVITGIILADGRGMLAQTFGFGITPTPGSFNRGGFSLGFLHGGIWALLLLLIIGHIGASLYHQFILKDNLMSRMWFGKRKE